MRRILLPLVAFVIAELAAGFALPTVATAQYRERISAGASIPVRTSEWINAKKSNGRIYYGNVDAGVTDDRGEVAIPRGSQVELVVRNIGHNEYVLDLESVIVDGRHYAIAAESGAMDGGRRDNVGENRRTAKYLGGGAVLGSIIGAIAGGGKGAAIGALAGAGAGAGTQIVTRGKALNIPSESMVTFRLEHPLTITRDEGYERDGHHYHRH